jgi:hypothetical protein
VSKDDFRITTAAGYAANTPVRATHSDVGTSLVHFLANDTSANPPVPGELFVDNDPDPNQRFAYTLGEPIYLDNDLSGSVSPGDTPLTPLTLGVVGDALIRFPTNPHWHPTMVAGTILGNGAMGGSPFQWRGVAPEALLRSYDVFPPAGMEHNDAIVNGAIVSTNPWGPVNSHCHQVEPPETCYDTYSQFYDVVVSGQTGDGIASGHPRTILVTGSAGNRGQPERHSDGNHNQRFDTGESIFVDADDDGTYSPGDVHLRGPTQTLGVGLVNFALDEMHDEIVSDTGAYEQGEGIYVDADRSRTVTVGDTRVSVAGYPDGSPVNPGDGDLQASTWLRQFRLWGTIRNGNAAKNTVQVGNVSSDEKYLHATSSRGPTDDGRVKPDLVAAGSESEGDGYIKSTYPGDTYRRTYGSSISTGAVAGAVALLAERYATACASSPPPPDVLKALLIHGAEDLTAIPEVGSYPGPDFAFGFGRVRALEAVDLVPHHVRGNVTLDNIPAEYTVTVGTTKPLRVTLVWNDPAFSPLALPSSQTGMLINDLDLELEAPDGTRYTPWKVDGSNPFAAATRSAIAAGLSIPGQSRDRRNTVEQVEVDEAMPGTWKIRVTASTLNLAPQDYALVSEMLPPELNPCASQPEADVWMKDNPNDLGGVPSSGAMYLGPDLWNRVRLDGGTAHQNPTHGQPNYLHANLRNASTVSVSATSIDIWVAAAAVGLGWPDNFTYVGRFNVPNMGPSEVHQVGPLEWYPPAPYPSDHFCLYMRVVSPQDPITYAEGTNIWDNAQWSNNIAYRNMNVVDLVGSTGVAFQVRNIAVDTADIDVAFHVPPEFLEQAQVLIEFSPQLHERWEADPRRLRGLRVRDDLHGAPVERGPTEPPYQVTAPEVTLPGFRLEPGFAETMTLTFQAVDTLEGEYDVYVTERIDGEIIGGILYTVRAGNQPD